MNSEATHRKIIEKFDKRNLKPVMSNENFSIYLIGGSYVYVPTDANEDIYTLKEVGVLIYENEENIDSSSLRNLFESDLFGGLHKGDKKCLVWYRKDKLLF